MKDLKQFISGLTFARGSNQPFISNAIVFLSSSRANIFRLFDFENTVEGIPLLILIYHMDNILTLHLFLFAAGNIWVRVAILFLYIHRTCFVIYFRLIQDP